MPLSRRCSSVPREQAAAPAEITRAAAQIRATPFFRFPPEAMDSSRSFMAALPPLKWVVRGARASMPSSTASSMAAP